MVKNFYKNPLRIVWRAKANLMPSYLFILWLIFLIVSSLFTFYGPYFDISSLTLENHFSINSTALALALALFVAGKDVFSEIELKHLANYKENGKERGQALADFIAPYVFTALIFFLTGIISLFGPFIKVNIDPKMVLILKILYLNLLSLGFFSLFNLIIIMLNDVFMKAFRKSEK